MSDRLSWEQYALEVAIAARARSEDPKRKVGSCILRLDHTIASVGYNGPPAGVEIDWDGDRDLYRPLIVHAESNALRYVTPLDNLWLLATTLRPCVECFKQIASYGIRKIVYQDPWGPYTGKDDEHLASMCLTYNVELQQLVSAQATRSIVLDLDPHPGDPTLAQHQAWHDRNPDKGCSWL